MCVVGQFSVPTPVKSLPRKWNNPDFQNLVPRSLMLLAMEIPSIRGMLNNINHLTNYLSILAYL